MLNPRPIQRPHPPFYIVANNPLSLDAAAEQGLPVFVNGALDLAGVARTASQYRSRAAEAGLTPPRTNVLLNRFVFVADSCEEAHRVMRKPFIEFLEQRAPDLKAYLVKVFGALGLDYDFLAREICIFGDVDHCVARLRELRERTGVEHILCTLNLITLDHRRSIESMRQFANEVMPRLEVRRSPFSEVIET